MLVAVGEYAADVLARHDFMFHRFSGVGMKIFGRQTISIGLSFLAGAALCVATTRRATPAAETIIVHAKVYTANSNQPWAEAVAVRDGKILAVGDEATIEKFRGEGTKVI